MKRINPKWLAWTGAAGLHALLGLALVWTWPTPDPPPMPTWISAHLTHPPPAASSPMAPSPTRSASKTSPQRAPTTASQPKQATKSGQLAPTPTPKHTPAPARAPTATLTPTSPPATTPAAAQAIAPATAPARPALLNQAMPHADEAIALVKTPSQAPAAPTAATAARPPTTPAQGSRSAPGNASLQALSRAEHGFAATTDTNLPTGTGTNGNLDQAGMSTNAPGLDDEATNGPCRATVRPKPPFPINSRRMGEEGRVHLGFNIDANGKATNIRLISSSGYLRLDQAALAAVKKWAFMPTLLRPSCEHNLVFSLTSP